MNKPNQAPPQIVEPNPSDWQAYRALRLEALQREPSAFGTTYDEALVRPDAFWIQRLTGDETIDLVAIVDGRMVGMVGAYLAPHDEASCAVVLGLYVSAPYRGHGLGRYMMEELLARLARRPAITTVRLWVNRNHAPALALYTALGFQVVPHPEDDDATAGTVRMERPVRTD